MNSSTALPIEFWFDFSSGYAFFAAREIEALGTRVGRPILWRPFMLGTAFRVTGATGLSSTPLKKDYARRDWQRLARRAGVAFAPPPGHPAVALAATRAFYWIEERDPGLAPTFARAVFDAYFCGGGLDTADVDEVAAFAARFGVDGAALRAGLSEPRLKSRVRELSESAVARGIFGSPFFLADGEPFWGWDRMPMLEDWVRWGGW